MTPAVAHFVSVGTIATALKTQVEDVLLADAATAAFERVELFDSESLLEAFQLLTISEQRICLVVPLTEHFETEIRSSQILRTRRTAHFALLISDRVLGNRTTALYGDGSNGTPGAYALTALTLPRVIGQLLPNPNGVVATPTSSDVIIVKNQKEKQNLPGRAAVALELACAGGWIEAALGRGPSL